MEEKIKERDFDIVEEEQSLLSFKIGQLRKKTEKYSKLFTMTSISTKTSTLKSSIQDFTENKSQENSKNDLPSEEVSSIMRVPLEKKKKIEQLKVRSTPLKTKLMKEIKKKNQTSIQIDQTKEKHKSRVTLKFIKKTQNNATRHRVIYEIIPSSIIQISGEGIIQLSNGIIMEGTWHNGQAVSPLKIRYQDKSLYEGEVYKFKPHGIGTLTYSSGCKYMGEFCYGDLHGQGILYDEEGRVCKIGNWSRGIFLE